MDGHLIRRPVAAEWLRLGRSAARAANDVHPLATAFRLRDVVPSYLRYADASIFAARLRWVALRIRLRIRNDFGVASTYSSESIYSIARSKLILSGASN